MFRVGIATFLVGFVTTWFVTPAVIRLGTRIGAVDHPGPRKVHCEQVPRIGGLAVFAGFLTAVCFAAFATGYVGKFPEGGYYWVTLALGAGAMLVLGFVDDLVGVRWSGKFAAQIAAALAAWLAGFRIESLSFPWFDLSPGPGAASLVLTVGWIVFVTNALNLIDGLDGLAVGSAIITCTTVAAIALVSGKVAVTGVTVALLGSLFGFLRFNFNPARIFLGDSGSMFLGFVLALVSIYGSQKNTTAVAVIAPVLVLGLPIFDTAFAVSRRTVRLFRQHRASDGVVQFARNLSVLFLPDRGHLHHRLLDLGLSHRGAVIVLYGFASALASVALLDALGSGMSLALLGGSGAAAVVLVTTIALTRASQRLPRATRGPASPPHRQGQDAPSTAP